MFVPEIDEEARLKALERYRILDTEPEPAFDDIVRLTSTLLQVPTCMVSLVDRERQWFKARHGLDAPHTPREVAFCDHAIRQRWPLVVPDAREDPRFDGNPLVIGAPHIRFYAGAPLRTPDGHALGTLCVIDKRARTPTAQELELLRQLARQVVRQLEVRRRALLLDGSERLASLVVRDMRRPVTRVLLRVVEAAGAGTPDQREAFELALEGVMKLQRLMLDAMDLCLADSVPLVPRTRPVSLVELARGCVRDEEGVARARRVRIELVADADATPLASLDSELMARVLNGLIGDAVLHAPPGTSVAVRVQCSEVLELCVEDSGAARDRGLGLAFWELAVGAHGGRVRVADEPQVARVCIELPL